jgi:hypothetical protein
MSKPKRPSFGTVIACLALFIALGGTATALSGRNTVSSDDIRAGNVRTSDLADGAVTTPKLDASAVTRSKLHANSVNGSKVGDGTLTGADVAGHSLTGVNINESSLTHINADSLRGSTPIDFQSAPQVARVDVDPSPSQETTIFNLAGLGKIFVDSGTAGCAAGATNSDVAYRNTTAAPVDFSMQDNSSGAAGQAPASATGFTQASGSGNGGDTVRIYLYQDADPTVRATVQVTVLNGGNLVTPSFGTKCRFEGVAWLE